VKLQNKLHTLLKQKRSEVIGFTSGRKPLTKKELIKRLEKGNVSRKYQDATDYADFMFVYL